MPILLIGQGNPLDPVVVEVRHVNISAPADRQTGRAAKLARSGPARPPLAHIVSGLREYPESVVVKIRNVHVAGRTERDSRRYPKAPTPDAQATPCQWEHPVRREDLNPVVI